jgi:hypothetical protein
MIESKDRSGWFGASDTDKIIGKWTSDTFAKWWMQKIGINRDHFDNRYTSAGTHMEHRILESLGIPMELDKQIILEDLRLRVNLDGNDSDTIYECKTYKYEKGFKLPRKYINQVQVQMFASGFRKAKIIVYGLVEEDYDNYFLPIDPTRRDEIVITYDERWVKDSYLPSLTYLANCLKEGRFP